MTEDISKAVLRCMRRTDASEELCRRALKSTGYDMDEAVKLLRGGLRDLQNYENAIQLRERQEHAALHAQLERDSVLFDMQHEITEAAQESGYPVDDTFKNFLAILLVAVLKNDR